MILLFKMPQAQCQTAVWCSKPTKAVMCLMKKTHVLDKLGSGVSHSVLHCEFNVNEAVIHIK